MSHHVIIVQKKQLLFVLAVEKLHFIRTRTWCTCTLYSCILIYRQRTDIHVYGYGSAMDIWLSIICDCLRGEEGVCEHILSAHEYLCGMSWIFARNIKCTMGSSRWLVVDSWQPSVRKYIISIDLSICDEQKVKWKTCQDNFFQIHYTHDLLREKKKIAKQLCLIHSVSDVVTSNYIRSSSSGQSIFLDRWTSFTLLSTGRIDSDSSDQRVE